MHRLLGRGAALPFGVLEVPGRETARERIAEAVSKLGKVRGIRINRWHRLLGRGAALLFGVLEVPGRETARERIAEAVAKLG